MFGMMGPERRAWTATIEAQKAVIAEQRAMILWLREQLGSLLEAKSGSLPDPYPEAPKADAPPRFPPEVQEAIDVRAGSHVGVRAELETYAEQQLDGEVKQDEVVASILLGADLSEY